MINQQGTPTFFFTLSATDTKWPDLHALIPGKGPNDSAQAYQWKVHNIISNPLITSQYMHNRFKTFLEEGALKRFSYNRLLVQVLYHLFLPIFLYLFFTLYNLFLIYVFPSHLDMNGNI